MFKRVSRLAVPRSAFQTRAASTKARIAANILGKCSFRAQSLKDTLKEVIPAKQEQLKKLVRLLCRCWAAGESWTQHIENRAWPGRARRD
jgi:hypothetical protein